MGILSPIRKAQLTFKLTELFLLFHPMNPSVVSEKS